MLDSRWVFSTVIHLKQCGMKENSIYENYLYRNIFNYSNKILQISSCVFTVQYVVLLISNSSLQSKYSLNSLSIFSHQEEIVVSESASYAVQYVQYMQYVLYSTPTVMICCAVSVKPQSRRPKGQQQSENHVTHFFKSILQNVFVRI